MNFYHF